MSRPLVILGTGGGALDVLDVVEAINAESPRWDVVGYLDDGARPGDRSLGAEVLGPLRDAARLGDCSFIKAIGSERSHARLPEILAWAGLRPERFATLVHPGASVSRRALLGRGVLVNFGVSVGGGAVVGDHVVLCPGSIVGHDARIEDYATVAPGAIISGHVSAGRACYLGAGSSVRQGLRVGERSLVGMGAVVVRDVPPRATVVGNPARPLPVGKSFLPRPGEGVCHEPR
jgi:sugar O-acyltransferase (sialic acid O-acetyltransferase NeuD family)